MPILIGCESEQLTASELTAPVCADVVTAQCPDPLPRYEEVAPIFEQRCASCHTGVDDAPWPLDNYLDVINWAPVLLDDLQRCTMPPADSGIAMTDGEREQLVTWLRCGYPE